MKSYHPRRVSLLTLSLFGLLAAGCGPKYQLAPLEPASPPVEADSGMVVAAHPLAAQAGIEVLKEGGNAVDAAVAALFVLNVVEPHASGLGGGGFALVKMADEAPAVIDYRERAPKEVDTAFYYAPADSLRRLRRGGTSVCVPGAPAGWAEMFDRWGTLPLDRLARDGIRLAEEGFPINPGLSRQIADNIGMISADPHIAAVFLKDSLPPAPGDTLRQVDLAQTFRFLTGHGLRSFYRGPIAEAIVAAVQEDSAAMKLADLEFYRVSVEEPVRIQYKGVEIYSAPPPSAGGATLGEALALIELTGAASAGVSTATGVHLMAQCIGQAYADAEARIGDPEFIRSDWSAMLTSPFAREAGVGIAASAKAAARPAVTPKTTDHGNTTHLVVADRFGNIVSITQSINYFFGAGVMAGSSGVLLNNQAADFSPPPDTMNLIGSRKRPRSNMTPIIAVRQGKPFLALGTPGGARITSTMAQIVVNAIDGGMDISAAIDYPRFFPAGEHLVLENRRSPELIKALAKAGYQLHFAGPYHYYFGGAHGIMISPETGKMLGAADKRRGGAARGF